MYVCIIENKHLCILGVPVLLTGFLNAVFRSFQRDRECTVSPPLEQQLVGPCLLALSAVFPQHILDATCQTLDFCLCEAFILSYQLFFFLFVSCEP